MPGVAANIEFDAGDGPAHFDGDRCRHRPHLEKLEASMQGGAVAEGFLGGRVGVIAGLVGEAEQPIRRCHDVFDLGTRQCLEQGDRGTAWFGMSWAGDLQFSQAARAAMQARSTSRVSMSARGQVIAGTVRLE